MKLQQIAFYMHDLSGGGVERMRLALIAELRARGTRVTLVVGKLRGPLMPLLPIDLPVEELGYTHMVSAVRPLARFLRRAQPDVLVSSLDHNNITAILARIVAGVSTRVVISQHNALSAEMAMGWRYRAIPWLYWLLQFGAHGIVAVSHGVADDLASTAWIRRDRITPIYNPVIGPNFEARSRGPVPHDWLVDSSSPVFVFAGRLSRQKDPEILLRAVALLIQRRPARLIVMGEGPLLTELQSHAARLNITEQVAFVGYQTNPLLWLRYATALVLCSRYEGLGNVLIEAMACETPVIATDCPHGPSEILQFGEFGRLVPVGDAAALAQAMLAHLDAPMKNALAARASVFTAASCASAHEALFDKLTHRPPTIALGMRFSCLRAEEIIDLVMRDVAICGVRLIVTPNIDHVRMLRHPDFAAAYNSAELVCPDGFPVLLYARLRGLQLAARVTGCDMFRSLAHNLLLAKQALFFVLENSETEMAVLLWSRALGIADRVQTIVAPQNFGTSLTAQSEIAAVIRAAKPSILIVTLGAPVSETFVNRQRIHLPPCWAMCVGQAVRVELGLTSRAPKAWRRFGLEWLWRVKQEPGRLTGRYVKDAMWFPLAVLQDLVRQPLLSLSVRRIPLPSHVWGHYHRASRYVDAGTPASANAAAWRAAKSDSWKPSINS